jgi:hypothetical protein
MDNTPKSTSRDELLRNVDSDYARYFLLKVSDLDADAADIERLADLCHAAFYAVHAAAMAGAAVYIVRDELKPNIALLNLANRIRSVRGLPPHPVPDGSPLEALQALLPLLEILDQRGGSDLRIRRVLQTLELHECGAVPGTPWKGRTAHHAAFSFLRDVLYEILFTTIGITGIAASTERPTPRYDPTIIKPEHWPHLRESLNKFRSFDFADLIEMIDLELARCFKSQKKQDAPPVLARKTALYLAADSAEDASERLRLDKEVRAIEIEIRSGTYRHQLSFVSWWDAHAEDLSRQLLLHNPSIVHFAMHGDLGVVALTSDGPTDLLVSADAIRQLFQVFTGKITVALFTVCCSKEVAESVVEHVDVAIGMDGKIGDESAVAFSRGFYRGISAGKSIQEAFELGVTEVSLQDPDDKHLPQLFARADVNPTSLLLVDVKRT